MWIGPNQINIKTEGQASKASCNRFPDLIHPASRGGAAHTASLFWIVTRTHTHIYIIVYIYIYIIIYIYIYVYGFVSQNSDEAYVHVRNRYCLHFSPPLGLSTLGNFKFSPRGGFPSQGISNTFQFPYYLPKPLKIPLFTVFFQFFHVPMALANSNIDTRNPSKTLFFTVFLLQSFPVKTW